MKTCKYHPGRKNHGNGLCRTCWDREYKWKRRGININTDQYFERLKQQNGTCIFCDRKPRPHRFFDVDHDHKTGKIRGLLCNEHNRALGVVEKNEYALLDMINYLEKNRDPMT